MLRTKRGNYREETKNINVVCRLCGKKFTAKRKTRQFCSKICISRNNNKPKGKRVCEYVPCFECSKLVYNPPNKQVYKKRFCSRDCMVINMKKSAFNFPCSICQKPIFIQPTQLKYRARSTCSPDCRKKLRDKRTKEKHESGVLTKHQLDRAERYSKKASDWRKLIFERDDYTCQFCGVRGTYLEADHIKPWAYFPELRYELSNGRTLCKSCHNTTKIGYHKMRKIYGNAY